MCKLPNKPTVTCLSFRHSYTHTHTGILTHKQGTQTHPSFMQSHIWWAILLVSSSLHFSLCLYTHLAAPLHLLRCDIPALCSHLLLLLLLLFLPPSLHLTLPPSISHSSPYHSICLPVSPQPARLIILPVYLTRDHAVARATAAIVYPLPGDWSPWQ